MFDLSLFMLVPLVVLSGTASATLAVSSFCVTLPVLASGFGVDIYTALYIGFLLDLSSGLILAFVYRKQLEVRKNWRHLVLLAMIAFSTTTVVAQFIGLHFVHQHEKRLKSGVGIMDFILAGIFFRKFFTLRGSENEEESELNENYAPIPESAEDTPNSSYEEQEDTTSHPLSSQNESLPPVFSKRMAMVVIIVFFFASLSGLIGFSGGNGYTVVWMLLFRWNTLSSTSVGSFFTIFTMSGIAIVYESNKKVNWREGEYYILISLATNVLTVLIVARYAKSMSEKWLCFLVGLLCSVIGIFVTIFSIYEENKD